MNYVNVLLIYTVCKYNFLVCIMLLLWNVLYGNKYVIFVRFVATVRT